MTKHQTASGVDALWPAIISYFVMLLLSHGHFTHGLILDMFLNRTLHKRQRATPGWQGVASGCSDCSHII